MQNEGGQELKCPKMQLRGGKGSLQQDRGASCALPHPYHKHPLLSPPCSCTSYPIIVSSSSQGVHLALQVRTGLAAFYASLGAPRGGSVPLTSLLNQDFIPGLMHLLSSMCATQTDLIHPNPCHYPGLSGGSAPAPEGTNHHVHRPREGSSIGVKARV